MENQINNDSSPQPRESINTVKKQINSSIKKKELSRSDLISKADEVGFKNYPSKIIQTDQYGFLENENALEFKNDIDNDKTSPTKKKKKELTKDDIKKMNKELDEWNMILKDYDNVYSKKKRKLIDKTRKGVPDSLRGAFWKKYLKINKYYQKNLYNDLCEAVKKEESENHNNKEEMDKNNEQMNNDVESQYEKSEDVILKDLGRTLPLNLYFRDQYGKGQRSLFHVLSAYAKYNKKIGYVQGMGFIVATLLNYMEEENSFYSLVSLMNDYDMENLYLPGFPSLQKNFYVLLKLMKKFVYKVYQTFKEYEVLPTLYASGWFLTIFTRNLRFDVIVRIFDSFFLEGKKVIFRFALAILKIKEKDLTTDINDSSDLLFVIKNLYDDIDGDKLINTAFKFSFHRRHIKMYEEEYELNKNNSNDEIMKILG